jgi:hypothetical protein
MDVGLVLVDRFQSLLSNAAAHRHDQMNIRLFRQAIGQMHGDPACASMTKGKLGQHNPGQPLFLTHGRKDIRGS